MSGAPEQMNTTRLTGLWQLSGQDVLACRWPAA